MLSCALKSEGYDITALEPTAAGFSHFTRLQTIVLAHAGVAGAVPTMISDPAEALDTCGGFDFSFSINVMEHVVDIGQVLKNIYRALKEGAVYRFICPNYAFPYEPHFNLPTVFSKSLTEKFLGRRMQASLVVADPAGTWASLNWITVATVRRICRGKLGVKPVFRADIFEIFLDRALSDANFQMRRGPHLVRMIDMLRRLGALRKTRVIPVAYLPVMDCSIIRTALKA